MRDYLRCYFVGGVKLKTPSAGDIFDLTTSKFIDTWWVPKYGDETVGKVIDATIKGSTGKVREHDKK